MVNALVNQLLFKPPKKHTYEFSHSIIRLTTQTGDEIAATFIRKKGAHVTILFSHGNAEDLNTSFHWMRRLSREINVNTIAYDYPGYGESSGEQGGIETRHTTYLYYAKHYSNLFRSIS
jgi:pimeloyl-ACP methyl ester carboxylesterase